MEYIIILMEINIMKENGKMVQEMDMVYFILKMEINMKENVKIGNVMEQEYVFFQMEINIKENLKIGNVMDMVFFTLKELIGNLKEYGKKVCQMVMVFYIFQKYLNIKENGIIIFL